MKERYLAIAAKHTPDDVKAIPVADTRYHGLANFDDEDENGFFSMEVPIPDNIAALWVYLHECAHFHLHRGVLVRAGEASNAYSYREADANLMVMKILDEEGIVTPLDVLKEEYEAFLTQVLEDDRNYERHPLCKKCIDEFERRIASSS